jgi:beta-glucosidase
VDGSAGEGVAPTRCSAASPYTGMLPVTWTRTVAQEPINVGDANYDPLVDLSRR